MGGKKSNSSAAENLVYNTGTYDTGLYGSSTSTKNGTTWNPTSFQSSLVNYAESNIPSLIQQQLNPSTNSEWYQANKAIRQQAQNDAFENQVINPLASRNLTRGSSVNALSNMFANDVARQEQQALLDESNRAGQLANQLLQYYMVPYSMMTDANAGAMNQSNLANAWDLKRAGMLDSYNTATSKNSGSDIGQIVGALAGTASNALGSIGSAK